MSENETSEPSGAGPETARGHNVYTNNGCTMYPHTDAGRPEGDAFAMPQTWDPQSYHANARFVADLAAPVVDLMAPLPGERILDVGCGDGYLTAKIAALGCDV